MLTGATQQFTAEAELSDGSTSTTGFDWSVAGGGAISVSGLFTAPGSPQTADITVTATLKGVSGTAVISEIKAPIPDPASITVTGGGLTGDTLTLTVPDATNLTSSVSPAGAPQGVTWEIADPTKATVTTAGRVTAVAAGSTTLTVKSSTKPSVTKVINVVVNPQPPTIAAKAAITGKSGGDSVAFTDMFTVQRSAASDYNFVVTPTAAGTVNAAGQLSLASTASGNVTVKATHKTETSVTATANINGVTPLPTIEAKAPITGKVGGSTTAFTTMFTATNSAASDYNFVVTPTEAGTVSAAGLLTLADSASGDVTVKATHKTVTSVTATATLTGVSPKATITGKIVGGKSAGGTVTFAEMFTVTNSAATNYSFVVTPTAAGSVNATSGLLTLSDTANDSVTVKATHKTQTSVTATSTIEDVIPKLTGLVVSAVSDGSVAGDTLTISDPSQPGVFNIASVPQGAPLGTIVYDVEGTDADKLSITISGDALTITLSGAITSEDTKVTLRTDPGSAVFKTYTVKSGA